jgi:peptidyl-prolyl cis-trans isomerase D
MIKTIRSQSPILLAIVLGLISLGLLVFYNLPNVEHLREGSVGKIAGEAVSRDDFRAAQDGTALMLRLQRGNLPGGADTSRMVNAMAWQKLVLLQAARGMSLRVGDDQVVATIQNIFRDKDGKYDAARYDAFVKSFLASQNVTEDRFAELIREELLTDKVDAAVAASAQVAPAEVDQVVSLRLGSAKTTLIRFRAADYASAVAPSAADVEKAYQADAENPAYRTPERRVVSWVPFLLSPADEKLDAKAKADAKHKLGTAAQDFAITALDQAKDDSKAFAALATAKGLSAQTTAPFAATEPPSGVPPSPAFNRAAFGLQSDVPVSDPVETDHGYYVLQLGPITASASRPLAEVRTQVEADLRARQAAMKAREAGDVFGKAFQAALGAGKPLPAAVQDAAAKAALKPNAYAVQSVPAFVPLQAMQANVPDASYLVPLSFSLQPGQASAFVPTDDGGLIVFLEKRDPAPPAEVATAQVQVRTQLLNRRRENLLNDWFAARMRQPGFEEPAFLKSGSEE